MGRLLWLLGVLGWIGKLIYRPGVVVFIPVFVCM